MTLHAVDLAIIIASLLFTLAVTSYMKRHTRSVADFLAANRCAGRYLLSTANWEALSSVVGTVAVWQLLLESGWSLELLRVDVAAMVTLLLAASGFIAFRFRETRALTLAQFYEMRYTRRVRIFAGVMIFVSGIVNFGIFPAVGSRFFVALCGLPATVGIFGHVLPTHIVFMAVYLSVALYFTLSGGQLTVLVADCLEGLIASLFFLALAWKLATMFTWEQAQWVLTSGPPGLSRIDPLDIGQRKDFNLWYIVLAWIFTTYTWRAWQGQSGFAAAAASPHEQKMALILGRWRDLFKNMTFNLLALGALIFMLHPDFAEEARQVNEQVQQIESSAIQKQMLIPTAIGRMLPEGVLGMFVAVAIFGLLACDGSMMQSFGSIFIQDVVMPFRRRPLSPPQHLRLLRLSIFGVGVWAFCFSLFFTQVDYVIMFQIVSSAIYLAGAGAVIIGGLYWRRGTAAGAWTAMLVGGSVAGGGMLVQQNWPPLVTTLQPWFAPGGVAGRFLADHAGKFPLNGQMISLVACALATVGYVVVSLATSRRPFDLERMLHRGQHAVPDTAPAPGAGRKFGRLASLIGVDENFTRGDKFVAHFIFWWFLFWAALAVAIIGWNVFGSRWPAVWLADYQLIRLAIILVVLVPPITIWLGVGTVRDMIKMERTLRTKKRDDLDDGRVVKVAEATHAATPGSDVAAAPDLPPTRHSG